VPVSFIWAQRLACIKVKKKMADSNFKFGRFKNLPKYKKRYGKLGKTIPKFDMLRLIYGFNFTKLTLI
jgi:hypothetical protein